MIFREDVIPSDRDAVGARGIELSRSTVRRILLGRRRAESAASQSPKRYSRRERYPKEGLLLQVDGNWHDWL